MQNKPFVHFLIKKIQTKGVALPTKKIGIETIAVFIIVTE